jgi:hypothetical protein
MMLVDEESIHWQNFPKSTQPSDYFTFNFDNRPKFHLNDGLKFNDKILTAVQLLNTSSGISLRVFGQKIENFQKSLFSEKVYNLTAPTSEKVVNGYGAGLSTKRMYFSVTNKGAIDFDWSAERIDAGQSFVPYFDGNDASFDYSAPVCGIGIVQYTNDKEYGGFLRPIISTIDYKKIFEMN